MMKKLMPVVLALGLVLVASPVLAANSGAGAQGTGLQQGTTTQTQQRLVSPSPTGNTVQNQNQVKTQNEGRIPQFKPILRNKKIWRQLKVDWVCPKMFRQEARRPWNI